MKRFLSKHLFKMLSAAVICSYFLLTGGVLDDQGVTLAPPKLVLTPEGSTNTPTLTSNRYVVQITDDDPGNHLVEYSICGGAALEAAPSVDPIPQYKIGIIAPGSTDTVWVRDYTNPDLISSSTLNEVSPASQVIFPFSTTFSVPGTWKVVLKARTITYRDRSRKIDISIFSQSVTAPGELLYSAWASTELTYNVTGTAPMPIKKYIIKQLSIMRAGEALPSKYYTFTDPANQYLDVTSPIRASLRFKFTPPAADTVAYPNLQGKYDINYANAPYQLTLKAQGSALCVYTLEYDGGVKADFIYNPAAKELVFSKKSKTVANGYDTFSLILQ